MRLLVFGCAGAVAIGVAMADASPPPGPYPLPVGEAQQRLEQIEFRSMLKGMPVDMQVMHEGVTSKVQWRFGVREDRTPVCDVTLVPAAADATHATLHCRADAGDRAMSRHGVKLMHLLVNEHVDAALRGRPFDHGAIGAGTAALMTEFAPDAARLMADDGRR